MAFAYRPPVNYRGAGVRTPSPESFTIEGGVALLSEAPADPTDGTYPVIVTVGGNPRTRVTTAPGVGEFRVLTQTIIGADGQPHVEHLPLLQFNAADEGLAGTADYYQTGTVLTAEWFASLVSFLSPLVGVADVGSLPAPTMDATKRGRRGDVAFLADSSMYYSDGSAWNYVSGQVQGNVAGAFTVAAALAMASDAGYAVDAAFATLLASGMTFDAVQEEVAAATMAHIAGVAGDAAYDGPLSWNDSTALAAVLATTMDAVQAEVAAITFAHAGAVTSNAVQAEVGALTLAGAGGIIGDAIQAEVAAMVLAHVGALAHDGVWQGGEVTLNLIDDFSYETLAHYYTNAHSGDYGIANGHLESNVTQNYGQQIGDMFILNGSSGTDYTVEGKVCRTNNLVHGEAVLSGLALRYANGGQNAVYVYLDSTGLHAVSYVWGTPTVIGDYLFTPVADTVYTINVVLAGSSCTVSLDGTQRISGTASYTGAGEYGLFCQRNTWDNSGVATTPTGLVYFDDLKCSTGTQLLPVLIDTFSSNSIASYTKYGTSSNFAISAGTLVGTPAAAAGAQLVRTGVSQADGTLTAIGKWSTGGGARKIGVVGRLQDGANFIVAALGVGGLLEAYTFTSGTTWTPIGSTYTATVADDTYYTIELAISGSAVTVKLNGTTRISGTTALSSAGTWGIYDEAANYDNGVDFVLTDRLVTYDSLVLV